MTSGETHCGHRFPHAIQTMAQSGLAYAVPGYVYALNGRVPRPFLFTKHICLTRRSRQWQESHKRHENTEDMCLPRLPRNAAALRAVPAREVGREARRGIASSPAPGLCSLRLASAIPAISAYFGNKKLENTQVQPAL